MTFASFMGGGIYRVVDSSGPDLVKGSPRVIVGDAAGAGGLERVKLPDARTLETGGPHFIIIGYTGTTTFSVFDNDENWLADIADGEQFKAYLLDNTTQAGRWLGYVPRPEYWLDNDEDADGNKFLEYPDTEDLASIQLKQFEDVPVNDLNDDIWLELPTGDVVEAIDRWTFYVPLGGSCALKGMMSSNPTGTPAYNMFQYADIRVTFDIGDLTSFTCQLWWHAYLWISLVKSATHVTWTIYDFLGSGTTNGNTAVAGDDITFRLYRATDNTVRLEYTTDPDVLKSDTGWTLGATVVVTGATGIPLKTGRAIITAQGASKSGSMTAFYKVPDRGDKYFSPPQAKLMSRVRKLGYAYSEYDAGGVDLDAFDIDESSVPAGCQLHYAYTSTATLLEPDKPTMVALTAPYLQTSKAAFKTQIEGDATIDKYLWIVVFLLGPAVTDNGALNDATPLVENPDLTPA